MIEAAGPSNRTFDRAVSSSVRRFRFRLPAELADAPIAF